MRNECGREWNIARAGREVRGCCACSRLRREKRRDLPFGGQSALAQCSQRRCSICLRIQCTSSGYGKHACEKYTSKRPLAVAVHCPSTGVSLHSDISLWPPHCVYRVTVCQKKSLVALWKFDHRQKSLVGGMSVLKSMSPLRETR